MDLVTISYRSVAATTLDLPRVEALAHAAQQRNDRANITGVLFFDGTYFMQTIEGPQTETMTLFRTILQDSRHSNLIPFQVQRALSRRFSDWSLNLICPEKTRALIPDMGVFSYTEVRLAQVHADLMANRF